MTQSVSVLTVRHTICSFVLKQNSKINSDTLWIDIGVSQSKSLYQSFELIDRIVPYEVWKIAKAFSKNLTSDEAGNGTDFHLSQ